MSLPTIFQSQNEDYYTYNLSSNEWILIDVTDLTEDVFKEYGLTDITMINKAKLLRIPGLNPVDPKVNVIVYKENSSNGPGPSSLIAGDINAGYYGIVPSSELITGDDLASLIGLTSGTSQHSNTDWLKFSYEGKTTFTPMKPIRYGISWDQINAVDAVYGDKVIEINGLQYKIRLWNGAENDPSQNGDSDRDAIGSEWNNLILPIHEQAADQSWAYPQYAGTNVPDWGIGFTDEDLLTHNSYGNGSYSWCQETPSSTTSNRVIRGLNGVSNSVWSTSSNTTASRGFRPVLELL